MGPIEALLFRLRQAARLADAERRAAALQQALGLLRLPPAAPPLAEPGNPPQEHPPPTCGP